MLSTVTAPPPEKETSTAPTGVVLLNMGGPDSLDAVEPFLYNLFNDNDIIPLPLRGFLLQPLLAKLISSRRSRFVRGYYELIGGRSPIADITRDQAQLLEERLNARASGERRYRCYVAMRYWHPFTAEALSEMQKDGVRDIVALSLYPHFTTATTGSSMRELRRRLRRSGSLSSAPLIDIDRFYNDPLYLDALTTQVRAGLATFDETAREKALVLFSAHGLPVSFIRKGDPYVEHLHVTIAGVMARLAAVEGRTREWRLSYQSRAGREKWLEPATDAMLHTLAAEEKRHVLAVPISFVSDHIETLYEIDLLFGDEAKKLNLDFHRAPSLNTAPEFIEALAGLVERRLGTIKLLDSGHQDPR